MSISPYVFITTNFRWLIWRLSVTLWTKYIPLPSHLFFSTPMMTSWHPKMLPLLWMAILLIFNVLCAVNWIIIFYIFCYLFYFTWKKEVVINSALNKSELKSKMSLWCLIRVKEGSSDCCHTYPPVEKSSKKSQYCGPKLFIVLSQSMFSN